MREVDLFELSQLANHLGWKRPDCVPMGIVSLFVGAAVIEDGE